MELENLALDPHNFLQHYCQHIQNKIDLKTEIEIESQCGAEQTDYAMAINEQRTKLLHELIERR